MLKKRLTLLLFPFFIIPIFFWNTLNNQYYISIISFLISYISLINVPKITQIIHEKPIYIEDLNLTEEIDQSTKTKFINIFIKTMEIMLSIVIAGLTNYTMYKLSTSSLDTFEKLGLFGGILSLYSDCQNYIGRILLFILNYNKKNFEENIKKSKESPFIRGEIGSEIDENIL